MYLLVMPKYWGKQIFSLGSFPEVGQKQKTEKRKRRGPNDGNNITMASFPEVGQKQKTEREDRRKKTESW